MLLLTSNSNKIIFYVIAHAVAPEDTKYNNLRRSVRSLILQSLLKREMLNRTLSVHI